MTARPPRRPAPRAAVVRDIALATALLAAVAVFHVFSRTRVVTAGYALGELQKQHAELVAANDALHLELAMQTSPSRLEAAAHTRLAKLGLAPPDRGAVLAAGPGRPADGPGRAGVDGVGDPSRPAEPALHPSPPLALRSGRRPPREP